MIFYKEYFNSKFANKCFWYKKGKKHAQVRLKKEI